MSSVWGFLFYLYHAPAEIPYKVFIAGAFEHCISLLGLMVVVELLVEYITVKTDAARNYG
jgi:hypothetical protein